MAKNRWSTGQFALLIGASVSSLKRWDRSGVLRAARWPNERRYYTDDHKRAVEAQRPRFDDEGSELIPLARFAELSGMSVTTLRRWDRSGKLVAARSVSSKRMYYTKDQLRTVKSER